METSIVQDDCDRDDIDIHIERNCFACIEEQREIDNKGEAETNFTDSFSQSNDVKRPVWPKEKQNANKLKQGSSVNIVKGRSGKRTKITNLVLNC